MSGMGLIVSCYFLCLVSSLIPWVNGELVLLSLSAMTHSHVLLVILVLLASMGQMTGKCVLYWSGRGAIPIKKGEKGRIAKALNSWKERLERSSKKTWGLVLISAISGIPPLYIMSILAGTFRLRFSLFIAVVMCGRLLHFGVIALIPQIGSNYFSLS